MPLEHPKQIDFRFLYKLLPVYLPVGGDTIAVLPVVVPLPLVFEAVAPFANAEAAPLVVLPLSHVGLGHVGVKLLVL